jgi:hypothetical protein
MAVSDFLVENLIAGKSREIPVDFFVRVADTLDLTTADSEPRESTVTASNGAAKGYYMCTRGYGWTVKLGNHGGAEYLSRLLYRSEHKKSGGQSFRTGRRFSRFYHGLS